MNLLDSKKYTVSPWTIFSFSLLIFASNCDVFYSCQTDGLICIKFSASRFSEVLCFLEQESRIWARISWHVWPIPGNLLRIYPGIQHILHRGETSVHMDGDHTSSTCMRKENLPLWNWGRESKVTVDGLQRSKMPHCPK